MANLTYIPEEPMCAVATALAPAALGIVRASGKNCIELFSRLFSRPRALLKAQGNTIVYGWIMDGDAKLDEALVSIFRAPKSFTGEDMVEISCHGGAGVVLAVYNLLIKNGFRQAQKGEFTFRAYLNRKADLTKAEAVREIIDSRTGTSQRRAAERLAGSLFDTIDGIKKRITATLAAIAGNGTCAAGAFRQLARGKTLSIRCASRALRQNERGKVEFIQCGLKRRTRDCFGC